MHRRHLKAIITRILRKYGIPVKAVVSFTSDNGANYILAGKLLGLDEAEEMMAEFEEPLESWAEGVELTQDDFHLQSVRCAEHTLQLAVDDACKSDEEFRPLLTSVKKLCNFLLELWLRVQRRRGVQFEEADAEDEENPDEPMAMALDDSEDEGVVDFKRFLERQNHTRLTRGGPANAPSSWSWKEKLRAKLDDYDRVVKPLPVTANVITYWEGKKLIWPELAELALIVLSIPATQVSVERLFSSLRFILRPQRHHLSAGNIDDVILLHTNPDIVKKLCEELQMLQTSSSGSNSTEDNSMQDTQETRSRSSSSSSLLSP